MSQSFETTATSVEKKIKIGVIVGLDLVGDGLIKLPFLRALRAAWPQGEIHWITTKGATAYQTLLRDVTGSLIDVVHQQPVWLPATRQTPPENTEKAPFFDIVFDTRGRWKDALFARRQIKTDLFLSFAFGFLLSDKRPPLFRKRPPHLVDRLLELVTLAAGYTPPSTGRLPVPEDLLAQARRILPQDVPLVGFAPGAGNAKKIWPRENFEKVANAQVQKGRIPVFILGPQESEWRTELQKAVPEAIFPLQAGDIAWGTQKLTVAHTMAIASLLSCAVSNDSGTGHMLAAVDCPLISLFGPTSPTKLAPRVTKGLVVRAQNYGGETMNHISPETVINVIESNNFITK